MHADGTPWSLLGPPLAESRDGHQERPTLGAGPSPSVYTCEPLTKPGSPDSQGGHRSARVAPVPPGAVRGHRARLGSPVSRPEREREWPLVPGCCPATYTPTRLSCSGLQNLLSSEPSASPHSD